jgi:hypothetical protein
MCAWADKRTMLGLLVEGCEVYAVSEASAGSLLLCLLLPGARTRRSVHVHFSH